MLGRWEHNDCDFRNIGRDRCKNGHMVLSIMMLTIGVWIMIGLGQQKPKRWLIFAQLQLESWREAGSLIFHQSKWIITSNDEMWLEAKTSNAQWRAGHMPCLMIVHNIQTAVKPEDSPYRYSIEWVGHCPPILWARAWDPVTRDTDWPDDEVVDKYAR